MRIHYYEYREVVRVANPVFTAQVVFSELLEGPGIYISPNALPQQYHDDKHWLVLILKCNSATARNNVQVGGCPRHWQPLLFFLITRSALEFHCG